MKKVVFSDHALFQMRRRGISEKEVRQVIKDPEQTEEVRPGRVVFQSQLTAGEPDGTFLLRVFVDVGKSGLEVVTVYRTRKIEKYWR
jgi:Domain of unknown function (DUF4258)